MQSISKRPFRFLSLVSIFLVLAFSFSCNKDKSDANTTNTSSSSNSGTTNKILPLIATADINFITDGETLDFKGYKEGNNIFISKDTTLMLSFNPVDENGEDTDGPSLTFMIHDSSGIKEGIYSIPSNISFQIMLNKKSESGSSIYAAQGTTGTATFNITSLTENHIIGNFEFRAKLITNQTPKEVEVTNGIFESDIIRV